MRLLPALAIAALIATPVGVVAVRSHNHFETECMDRGGHVGPQGLCLMPDGRVIEKDRSAAP